MGNGHQVRLRRVVVTNLRLTVAQGRPAFDDWYPIYLRALTASLSCLVLAKMEVVLALTRNDGVRLMAAWLLFLLLRLVIAGGEPVARYSHQHVLLLRLALVNGARCRNGPGRHASRA